jgi:hypothetical protein
MNSPGQRRILFIIGFPRSGTKLLRSVLNNHPRIFITSEMLFLPYLLDNWDRYGDLSNPNNFGRMHADITRTFYFAVRAEQGLDIIDAEQWHAACESFDPTGILLPLLRHETGASEDEGIWLGDKSPNYTTHLAQIKRALPEAKIIHIVRDVRDAALSARKIWKSNIYRYAQRWADGMRPLSRELESLPARDCLELRYEDLLSEPAATLSRVTDFLELEFREDMINLGKPSENFGDAKEAVGIMSGNTRKYKTQLSGSEQNRIEAVCSEVLRHYGYEVATAAPDRRLSRVRMTCYMLADIGNRILFDLRLGRSYGFVLKSMLARLRTRL